jgi:DNA repair protein RadC
MMSSEIICPEYMKVMYISEGRRTSVKISSPSDSYQALSKFHKKRQEHFMVITLNGAHYISGIRIVSIGLVNRTVVHPREIYNWAIRDNACAIIMAHNHPSGQVDPSPEDREITTKLVKAGQIMGIAVLDHLVISKLGYFSFLEHGLIDHSDTLPDSLNGYH